MVSRANSFSNSCVVFVELEGRHVGFDLGHRPNSSQEFLVGSHSHPLVAPSVLQFVSEPVSSLVILNRLCDPKAT
jgi:hypothetical protein